MPGMTRIGIVTASTRPRRIGHHVATWVRDLAPQDVTLVDVDLRELALPLLDEPEMPSEGHYAHEHTRRWAALVESLDAVVLVMPEYNRGYNAALKNAIDYLYAEWEGMPVACVGYGWSGAHFARSALRQTLERIKMVVVEGAALHFEKTLDLDGTVHAGASDVADVERMFAGLVAAAAPASPASGPAAHATPSSPSSSSAPSR
jgi:NAD(P)H-dependent FMN reductase